MDKFITFNNKEELQTYLREGGIVKSRPGDPDPGCFYDKTKDKYYFNKNEQMSGIYSNARPGHKWIIIKPTILYKFSF